MKVIWVKNYPFKKIQNWNLGGLTYSKYLRRKDREGHSGIITIFAYNCCESDYIKWLGKVQADVLIIFSNTEEGQLLDFLHCFTDEVYQIVSPSFSFLELPKFLAWFLRPQIIGWSERSPLGYQSFEVLNLVQWQRSITRRNLRNCLKILWEAQKI